MDWLIGLLGADERAYNIIVVEVDSTGYEEDSNVGIPRAIHKDTGTGDCDE